MIRSGADLASTLLEVLPPGTAVTAAGDPAQRRLLVETDGRETGWITKKFAARHGRGGWRAGAQGAVLRAGQPLASERLRTLRPGEGFRLVAERVRVEASDGSVAGWASVNFLDAM